METPHRFFATAPFMAYPQGRLVRGDQESETVAVLTDQGEWAATDALDYLLHDGPQGTQRELTTAGARDLAAYLGHPDAVPDEQTDDSQ